MHAFRNQSPSSNQVREIKLLEKHVRHARIVVLAGMNKDLVHAGSHLQCVEHGRHLHEIWACTDDVQNFQ